MRTIFEASIREPYHHAYVVEGTGTTFGILSNFLAETFDVSKEGNSNFFRQEYELFGVDDARALRILALRAAAGRKIFVVSFQETTHEAQNTLLKTFEEPTPATHFFLVIPRAEMILPTLRSRMAHIALPRHVDETLARDFLAKLPHQRILYVQKLVKGERWGEIAALIDSLEAAVSKDRTVTTRRDAVLLVRKYWNDRGSSPKMLLEQLALAL